MMRLEHMLSRTISLTLILSGAPLALASDRGTVTWTVSSMQLAQEAVDKVGPGDTIILQPGRYVGELHVRRSGEPGKPITIKSSEPWQAAIEASGGYGDGIRLATGVHDVVIESVLIYGARFCGVRFQLCDRISIVDCRIELCRAQGLLGSGSAHTVRGCMLQRNGLTKWDHGLYLSGSGHIVTDNLARANAGWGLHLYPRTDGCLVARNVCYANGFVGLLLWEGQDNLVFGNCSFANGRSNYQWQFPHSSNRVFLNVEEDPRRWPLKVLPETVGGWPLGDGSIWQPN